MGHFGHNLWQHPRGLPSVPEVRRILLTSPVYHGDAQALPARTGKRREILPLGDAVEKIVRSGQRHTGRIASKAASGKVHFAI